MREIRLKTLLFFIIFNTLMSCQGGASNWPECVLVGLWVPREAYNVKRQASEGAYTVSYELKVCQPANGFIAGMVEHMKKKGWKRLELDPYNFGLKLNHAKVPDGLWDRYHHRPGGYDVLQWIDDWEDTDENIVRYWLRYKVAKKDFENACNLEVVVSFAPATLIKDIRVDKKKYPNKNR